MQRREENPSKTKGRSENCQKKLKEIKNDIKENEDKQKKQVDYLKKVRRKNKIKSILIAAGIILIIIFIKYLYNFALIINKW